jgi:hypothetical protein
MVFAYLEAHPLFSAQFLNEGFSGVYLKIDLASQSTKNLTLAQIYSQFDPVKQALRLIKQSSFLENRIDEVDDPDPLSEDEDGAEQGEEELSEGEDDGEDDGEEEAQR